VGHVWAQGTQHNPAAARNALGIPTAGGAGTLALTGNLKEMSADFLRAASLTGYGVSLAVGVGVPIPILDEDLARTAGVGDEEISAPVIDYSTDYPNAAEEPLANVTYAELKSGRVTILGREVPTAGLSSYSKALAIARTLRDWILAGRFVLSEMVAPLPGPATGQKSRPFSGRVFKIE
jgi:uncharacterized protein (DUF39 family)